MIAAPRPPEPAAPSGGRRLAVLGLPFDGGAGRRGAAMGPAALRVAGLIEALRGLGLAVEDLGDLPAPAPLAALGDEGGRARNLPLVAPWCRAAGARVLALLGDGALPVLLGGDHALSMGTADGAARFAAALGRPLHVLWIDAHADFNTPATTPSGNMHGMSTALLTGEPGLGMVLGEEGGPRAIVPPHRLHVLGARSIDAAERGRLRARGADVVDMRLIDEAGLPALLRRVLAEVAAEGALLHVSLDADALDPALAPGVGTPVPGGLTYREAHLIMEVLHDSGLVTSLDVVELNPFLDERGRTALLLVDLVASLFGRSVLERPEPAPPPAIARRVPEGAPEGAREG